MTNQEQIEEMAGAVICAAIRANAMIDRNVGIHLKEFASELYNAGYRKVICDRDNFTDLLNEETKELSLIKKTRKETAKEILQRVVNICKNEEEFQDGTVNTQLEPLYFGIANGCNFIKGEVKKLAKEYGVEVRE